MSYIEDNNESSMEYISKTKKKKEAESLQELGAQLVELPDEKLGKINLPAELYDAVVFAKTLTRRARKRQIQYIGTLMRRIDAGPVKEALESIDRGDYIRAAEFKKIEKWRDELVAGNETLIDEILGECPAADKQHLAQLVRSAIKERDENSKPPREARALFRYLKKVRIEKPETTGQ